MQVVKAKGFDIPIVGLGTWMLRGRECARLVEQAIRLGYRHIDTAQMYENEREVGEGVRASGKRREVMVTTKIQPSLLAPRDVERSVRESLQRLHIDEIDLLLIHWPNPRVPLSETLGAMAKLKQAGLVRALGVSNFTVALLEEANKVSPEPLVCNQIEIHPFLRLWRRYSCTFLCNLFSSWGGWSAAISKSNFVKSAPKSTARLATRRSWLRLRRT